MVVLKRAAVLIKRCLANHHQTSNFHTKILNSAIPRVASTSPHHLASSLQHAATTTTSPTSSAAAAVRARLVKLLTGTFPILALVTPSARPAELSVHRSIRYGKTIHGLNFASQPFARVPLRMHGRRPVPGMGPVSTFLNASRSFTSVPAYANPVVKKAAGAFRHQASSMSPLANLTHNSFDLERNSSEQRTLRVRRGVVCETQNDKRFNPLGRPATQIKRNTIRPNSVSPVASVAVSPNESICESSNTEGLIIPRVCATFSDFAEFVPRPEDDQLVQVYMSLLLYGPVAWEDAVRCSSPSNSSSENSPAVALSGSIVRNIADVVDFQTFHLRSVTRILQRLADCAADGDAFRVERHGCELRVLFPRGCPLDRVRRGLIAVGIEPDSAHFMLEMEELADELRANVWKDMEGGVQEDMMNRKEDVALTVPETKDSPLESEVYLPDVEAWRNIETARPFVAAEKGGFDSPDYLKGVNDFLSSVDEMASVHFERRPSLTYSRAALALDHMRSVDEFTNAWA